MSRTTVQYSAASQDIGLSAWHQLEADFGGREIAIGRALKALAFLGALETLNPTDLIDGKIFASVSRFASPPLAPLLTDPTS